jgi:hypothetical protein
MKRYKITPELKEEILFELKQKANQLKHSPTRREIPKLAWRCRQYLGSFNKSKEMMGLEINHKIITKFPRNAFRKDKEMAKIAAYLVSDGHIYKDLSAFFLSSKYLAPLKDFEEIIENKFGIKGKYKLNYTGTNKVTHIYIVFNTAICKELVKLGIPNGEKVAKKFSIPSWIRKDKELTREYLKILFFCEGSKYKHSKNKEIIKINFHKEESRLADGVKFVDSIKKLLNAYFNIETSNIWIIKGNNKKDGTITKQINLYVKSTSVNKFINEIGWLK